MGENEQSGMLRTVVVIGIIAMVALIMTLGVVGLKNNMTKNINETSVPSQLIDSSTPLKLEDPTQEKYVSISGNKIVLDTLSSSNNFWVRYDTMPALIPNGSKTVKLTVTGKGSVGSMYSHPWMKYFDKTGKEVTGSGIQYVDVPITGKLMTASVVATIPDGAYTYAISFQSRQLSHIEYESATVTFRQL